MGKKKQPKPVGETKAVQDTLKGKGFDPDACGKAALDYIEADSELQTEFQRLKNIKAQKEEQLKKELKKANRTSISIDGYTVTVNHVDERDVVKIKKPRLKEEG